MWCWVAELRILQNGFWGVAFVWATGPGRVAAAGALIRGAWRLLPVPCRALCTPGTPTPLADVRSCHPWGLHEAGRGHKGCFSHPRAARIRAKSQ